MINIGKDFFFIAGNCAFESEDICQQTIGYLDHIFKKHGVPYIYKCSFDKANRTKLDSYRGVGLYETMDFFSEMKRQVGVLTTTDVHNPQQATDECLLRNVDVIQIPAFLSRQTDILQAVGGTGKWVSIKKGQFMNATKMLEAVKKVGHSKVVIIERGNMYGDSDVVIDYRNIVRLTESGVPVVLDVTHTTTEGVKMNTSLAKAGKAVGACGIFFETHPEPRKALCDADNVILLDEVEGFIIEVMS